MQMLLLQAQSAVLTRRARVKLKKRCPFGNRFLQGTKRTGLEPATSAVTGLRSNQTELPLLAFGCSLLSVGCEGIIHESEAHCKLFFVKNAKKVKFSAKNGKKGRFKAAEGINLFLGGRLSDGAGIYRPEKSLNSRARTRIINTEDNGYEVLYSNPYV